MPNKDDDGLLWLLGVYDRPKLGPGTNVPRGRPPGRGNQTPGPGSGNVPGQGGDGPGHGSGSGGGGRPPGHGKGGGGGGGGGAPVIDTQVAMVQGQIGGSGTGLYTVSDESVGFTPKFAVVSFSVSSVLATSEDTDASSFGVCDGSNQWAQASISNNGSSVTQTVHTARNDAVAMSVSHNSQAIINKYEFSQFVENGIEFNCTAGGAFASYVNVLLIGGDIETSVGQATLADTAATTVTVGFQPSFVITMKSELNATPADNSWAMNTGFGTYDGTTHRQCSWANYEFDNNTVSNLEQTISNSIYQPHNTSTNQGLVTFENVTATGFDLTTDNDRSGQNINYAAVKLTDSAKVWCGTLDTPTSTGDWNITDPGFEPLAMLAHWSNMTAVTQATSQGAHSMLLAADNDYGMVGGSHTETSSKTNTSRRTDDTILVRNKQDSANLFAGTFTGFTVNGADINLTTTQGAARKIPALFFG